MTKYSCKCISPGCKQKFIVLAKNNEDAIRKIMKTGEDHIFDKHPELPIMSSEVKRKLVADSLEALCLALGFMVSIVSMPPVV